MSVIETIATRFIPRARIHGLTWTCPWCGRVIERKRKTWEGWRVRCLNRKCRRVFILGVVMYVPSRGPQKPPRDWIVPSADEPLPRPPVARRSNSREATHVLVEASEADFS